MVGALHKYLIQNLVVSRVAKQFQAASRTLTGLPRYLQLLIVPGEGRAPYSRSSNAGRNAFASRDFGLSSRRAVALVSRARKHFPTRPNSAFCARSWITLAPQNLQCLRFSVRAATARCPLIARHVDIVRRFHPSHCERSEAIQRAVLWIAASPAAPRND